MSGRSESDVVGDLVRQYLREIGAYPLLTAADEAMLGAAMAAGREAEAVLASGGAADLDVERREQLDEAAQAGRDAKRRFIQANLRLVVSIAKRYHSGTLPLLDLVQEGNLGLIRAVEKFEPDRGCKFSTYATWWIRQAISRAIADKGRTIRIPVHVADAARRVHQAAARAAATSGAEATIDELSAATALPVHVVADVLTLLPDAVSLHTPLGLDDAEGSVLADVVTDARDIPFEETAAAFESSSVHAALVALSPREQEVLRLRFGLEGDEPRTLEQVGRAFRVTRERIRQIEAKALTKLRHPTSPPELRSLATRH